MSDTEASRAKTRLHHFRALLAECGAGAQELCSHLFERSDVAAVAEIHRQLHFRDPALDYARNPAVGR
jgi:hypothetical protein